MNGNILVNNAEEKSFCPIHRRKLLLVILAELPYVIHAG